MKYEAIQKEKELNSWAVGIYLSNGQFYAASFHDSEEEARVRAGQANNIKMVSYDPDTGLKK